MPTALEPGVGLHAIMGIFGLTKKTLAEVPVPGETSLTLPVGKISVRYVEDRENRTTDIRERRNPWKGPGSAFTFRIEADGQEVAVKKPRADLTGSKTKTIHQDLGSFELSGTGEVKVITEHTLGENVYNPRLVFRQ